MSNQIINSALALRLKAMGLPTQFENSLFTPTPGTLYLAEFFLPAGTTPLGLAFTSTSEFRGLYQVSVFAPKDGTKKPGMDAAALVAAQFSRDTFLDAAGNKVSGTSAAGVLHCERVEQYPALPSGDRWVIPVRVRYLGLFTP